MVDYYSGEDEGRVRLEDTNQSGDFPASFAVYQTQFMGASVKSFTSRIGWGTDSSEVTVELVEDTCLGTRRVYADDGSVSYPDAIDSFRPPRIGEACFFYFGSFSYGGILYNWEAKSDTGGEAFVVRLRSPAIVLANTQIILQGLDNHHADDIYGNADSIPGFSDHRISTDGRNMRYFYFDYTNRKNSSQGIYPADPDAPEYFSFCNDIGVKWEKLRWLTTSSAGIYDIMTWEYKKNFYRLKLSSDFFDDMPNDYVFQGDAVDLLSALDRVCKASGRRMYIQMEYDSTGDNYHWISVKSHSFTSSLTTARDVDKNTNLSAAHRLTYGSIHQLLTVEYASNLGLHENAFGYGGGATISPKKDPYGLWSCHKLMSTSRGLEASDNVTHAYVNGDYFQDLWECTHWPTSYVNHNNTSVLAPITIYWGAYGVGGAHLTGLQSTSPNTDNESVTAYMPGAPSPLSTNVLEMRVALEGFDNWMEYRAFAFPSALNVSKLNAKAFAAMLQGDAMHPGVALNHSKQLSQGRDIQDQRLAGLRMHHEAISSLAENYGKKWFVPLSFIQGDGKNGGCGVGGADSVQNFNWEKSDGGWPRPFPEGNVFNLPWNGTDMELFKGEDGRAGCIIKIPSSVFPIQDFSKVDGAYINKGSDGTYFRGSVEDIVWSSLDNTWGAIVTGGTLSAVTNNQEHAGDSITNLDNALLYMIAGDAGANDKEKLLKMLHAQGREIKGLSIAPAMFGPNKTGGGVTIPLKSNAHCYGKYEAIIDEESNGGRNHGKSVYERNSSLNPWTFGSGITMHVAGRALANSMISTQGVLESGQIQFAGVPADIGVNNLGDALDANGPNVTAVSSSVGVEGFTTSITFRTFVRNFGELTRHKIEWMERIGQNQQKMQRAFNLRMLGVGRNGEGGRGGASARREGKENSGTGKKAFNNSKYGANSSLPMLIAQIHDFTSGYDYDNPPKIASASIQSVDNTMAALHGDFAKKAAVSMDAIFRPYSIGESSDMAEYSDVEWEVGAPDEPETPDPDNPVRTFGINAATLNPFLSKETADDAELGNIGSGCDFTAFTSEETMPEAGTQPDFGDRTSLTNVRSMALRGPLIISGWGYDTNDKPVPAKGESGADSLKFEDSWMSRAETWKTGPLDTRWNEERGVWEAGGGTSVVKIKELKYASGEWTAKLNDTDEEIECEDFMGLLGTSLDDFASGDGLKGFALKPSGEDTKYAIINAFGEGDYPLLHLNYKDIHGYAGGDAQAIVIEAETPADGHALHWEDLRDCDPADIDELCEGHEGEGE